MKKRIPLEPLIVAHLFPEMRAELLRILGALTDDEWDMPTACEGWSVRDVALHLLGDDVGLLSNLRDQDGHYHEFEGWEALVAFINTQNQLWVKAARRISRRLLLSLLEFTGQQVDECIAALDPHELSGPIGWAGSGPDPMWLHVARELTEYWMHHQHICEAVGRTSLKDGRFMQPVLSTFVHAFPHTYREVDAPADALVKIIITGDGGGEWHLVREPGSWKLYAGTDLAPTSTVTLEVDVAWRMFTNGIGQNEIRRRAVIEGDMLLGEVALRTTAIIA